jgi:hypothetical protein
MTHTITLDINDTVSFSTSFVNILPFNLHSRCLQYLGYVPHRNGNNITFRNEHDVTIFFLCCFKDNEIGISGHGNFVNLGYNV